MNNISLHKKMQVEKTELRRINDTLPLTSAEQKTQDILIYTDRDLFANDYKII